MNIALTIPNRFYRALNDLRVMSDKKLRSESYIYDRYIQIIDIIGTWMNNQVTGPCKVIGVQDGRTFILQPDNSNPFNVYWTMDVQRKLSEQYRFGGLWERGINDP